MYGIVLMCVIMVYVCSGYTRVEVIFSVFFLMIRRPPRSTQSRSSAASDVYKRQIQASGVLKVLISLFASPVIGFLAGILIANLIYLLSWRASPRVNGLFKRLQIITSLGLALSHGTNDAQKTMGIITLGLLISGRIPSFHVPFWVVVVCAAAIALGTSVGSWQLIRTLGSKFYKIYPVHGFASQLTSAAVILAASLVGDR